MLNIVFIVLLLRLCPSLFCSKIYLGLHVNNSSFYSFTVSKAWVNISYCKYIFIVETLTTLSLPSFVVNRYALRHHKQKLGFMKIYLEA